MQVRVIDEEIINVAETYRLKYPYEKKGFLGKTTEDINFSLATLTRGSYPRHSVINIHPLLAAIVVAIENEWSFGISTSTNGVVCPDCGIFPFRYHAYFDKSTEISHIVGNSVFLTREDSNGNKEKFIIDLDSVIEMKVMDADEDILKSITIDIKVLKNVISETQDTEKTAVVALTSRSYSQVKSLLQNVPLPEPARKIEPDNEYVKLSNNVFLIDNLFKMAALFRDMQTEISHSAAFENSKDRIHEALCKGEQYIVTFKPITCYGHRVPVVLEVEMTPAAVFSQKLSEHIKSN